MRGPWWLLLVATPACVRAAEPELCPEVAPGDLVITELRGGQTGDDNDGGQYVEFWNGSGQSIDALGLSVRLLRLDGSSDTTVLIRSSVTVAADDYLAVGVGLPDVRVDYVDYWMGNDFDSDVFSTGALIVSACGVEIDRVVYDLPSDGSYSLGVLPPDPLGTDGNDNPDNWCTDPAVDGAVIGTPGEANTPCE